MFVVRKIYTEDEIQAIINKVETAKPWDSLLSRIEFCITGFNHYFLFTLFGWNFACFLSIYYNLPKEFSLSLNIGNDVYYVNLLVVLAFSLLDILFYFLPSRYDKMSESDWVREILKQEYDKWKFSFFEFEWQGLISFLYCLTHIIVSVWGGLFYCFLFNFIFFFSLAIIYKKYGFIMVISLSKTPLHEFVFKGVRQCFYMMPLLLMMIGTEYFCSYVFEVYIKYMVIMHEDAIYLLCLSGMIIAYNYAFFYHHILKGAYISKAMAK